MTAPHRPLRPPLLRRPAVAVALALALLLVASAAACGDDDGAAGSSGSVAGRTTIRLLAHDSFAVSKEVLAAFTEETGIRVELVQGGDAGKVVNQAILTKGSPQADVLFGVDSTLLTRALDADLFEPYESPALAEVDPRHLLDPEHRVTPVDYGDVCLNYDKGWFADHDVPVPTSLEDLVEPAYKDLLVVENPATSSTGLAFLLSSVAHFGADGYLGWWKELKANGVAVVDGWEQAYNSRFSGAGDHSGDRPLVVSYASSPPAEVVYADPPIDDSPTGVVTAGCYRQVEGAGILRGTEHQAGARRLVDFLLSAEFQADVPSSMFVYPVRRGVELPDVFARYAVTAEDVAEVPPADIEAHRSEWIDAWTDAVVR
jgi:thiamine transport system substrate-binding protein